MIDLPSEIGKLISLRQLSIAENRFEQLLPAVGLLTNLVVLDVSENKLNDLPASLGALQNLDRFTFDG